jgi:hypothetical protein
MASLLQHSHHDCHNIGVNQGPEEHSEYVLAMVRSSWIETILRWDDTKSVTFDGIFYQGHGGTWVRHGALENVVVTVTYDHSWTSGVWPNKRRHREIRYGLDYDVRVDTLPSMPQNRRKEVADGPWGGPELDESLFDTKED